MDVHGRSVIKKPFLAGNTIRVRFRIIDRDTGDGFVPDEVFLTVYDLELSAGLPSTYRLLNPQMGEEVGSVIVNDQDGVDVTAFVDSTGLLEFFLTPDDTSVDIPDRLQAIYLQRRLEFYWNWDTPEKRGAHEIWISLAPNRASVAA